MPRAKTGCNYVLYTAVTKDSLEKLEQMVKKLPKGVSRPMLVDAILKRAFRQKLPRITVPVYTAHKRATRRSLNKAAA